MTLSDSMTLRMDGAVSKPVSYLGTVQDLDQQIRNAQSKKYYYHQIWSLWYILPEKLYPTDISQQHLQVDTTDVSPQYHKEMQIFTWPVIRNQIKSQTTDLMYRLDKLPSGVDRTHHAYLVIPTLWVITPVHTVTQEYDPANYTAIKSWLMPKAIHNKYLKYGVLRMPDGPFGGQFGNIVLFGHSAFVNSYGGNFNTVFARIATLQGWDKVYLYEKQPDKTYKMYDYRVVVSQQIDIQDTSVMLPGMGANMTLITNGLSGHRNVVKLKLTQEIDHHDVYLKLARNISTNQKFIVQKQLTDIVYNQHLTQDQKNSKLQQMWSIVDTLQQSSHQTWYQVFAEYVKSEIIDLYDGGFDPIQATQTDS